jgi:hypothetical protein
VNDEKFRVVLEKHRLWVAGKPGGERADLCDADLFRQDLCGAILRAAELHGADLRGANMLGANLRWADLRWSNLFGANLRQADLRWADLRRARYNVREVLGINMGALPNHLVLELMRRNTAVCGTKAMDAWAQGGVWPFDGSLVRPFLFQENRTLWPVGQENRPTMDLTQVWAEVAKTLEIKI